MPTTANKSEAKPALAKLANTKPPETASASIPDTLASLKVNPETGLARAEVDVRRQQHGYNEVAEQKGHPVLNFLKKFWGISAWMLELIWPHHRTRAASATETPHRSGGSPAASSS